MWPFLSNTGRQARAFTRYEAAGCHLLQRASVESCKLRLHEAGARQPGLICITSFEALLSRGCFAKQTHSLQYTWSEPTSKIYQSLLIVIRQMPGNIVTAAVSSCAQVDDESWACTPAFAVELVIEGDGYTGFSPTFSHLEDVCMQALQQCISAAASIPRVGNTSTKGNQSHLQAHTPINQRIIACIACCRCCRSHMIGC